LSSKVIISPGYTMSECDFCGCKSNSYDYKSLCKMFRMGDSHCLVYSCIHCVEKRRRGCL